MILAHSVNALAASPAGVLDLAGKARDPFANPVGARVFLFVRNDCPITNRYAPELARIVREFSGSDAEFWLVYPDPKTTPELIRKHMIDFGFLGQPLRDPGHELVKLAHATTAPEAAVFDREGKLAYHGRIDDLWADPLRSRPMARTHDLEDAIIAVLAGKAPASAETKAVGCSLADVQ